MALGKLIIPEFIKAGASRPKSTDITDENNSAVDAGLDFVASSSQSTIHPVFGTNVVKISNRKD